MPLLIAILVRGLLAIDLTQPCQITMHRAQPFVVCAYPQRDYSVRVFHRDDRAKVYASLDRVRDHVPEAKLLVNGGMFHPDRSPVGLLIQGGRKLHPLNRTHAPESGNFFMLPNGVFWGDEQGTHVTSTQAFAKGQHRPRFATQSGPMLCVQGRLHPAFSPSSKHRKIRNGVGVSADGSRIYFVISTVPVTFWELGTLFLGRLGTPNALYLDGVVSAIDAPYFRHPSPVALGPILGVFRKGR